MQPQSGCRRLLHVRSLQSRCPTRFLQPHINTRLRHKPIKFSTCSQPRIPLNPPPNPIEDETSLLSALNEPFVGSVSIKTRNGALQIARQDSDSPIPGNLVLWTDASGAPRKHHHNAASPKPTGISIVWRSPNPHQHLFTSAWSSKTFKLLGTFTTMEAEFFAILEALKIAQAHLNHSHTTHPPPSSLQLTPWTRISTIFSRLSKSLFHPHFPKPTPPITKITIYTDSLDNITHITHYHTRPAHQRSSFPRPLELAHLKLLARQIQHTHNIPLTISWVPAHEDIEGNERAHVLAARARKEWSLVNMYPSAVLTPPVDGYLKASAVNRYTFGSEKSVGGLTHMPSGLDSDQEPNCMRTHDQEQPLDERQKEHEIKKAMYKVVKQLENRKKLFSERSATARKA